MRGVYVASLLMAVLIALMIFTGLMLENAGEKLCTRLGDVCEDVINENWDEAETNIKVLKEEWEENEKWITMLVNHNETEEVVKNLYALEQYILYRETPELMATAKSLEKLFEHIPGKERPTLENII